MRSLFIGWIRDALALWVAILLVPGIYAHGNIFNFSLVLILFGFVSTALRPAYLLFSFPIILITTAPLMLIFNTLILWLYAEMTGYLGLGLTINRFESVLLGSLTISIIRSMATGFTLMLSRKFMIRRERGWLEKIVRCKIWLEEQIGGWVAPVEGQERMVQKQKASGKGYTSGD